MSISAISRRYATALVKMGAEESRVEEYGAELARVEGLFASQDLLRLVLESPTFATDKKSAILNDLTAAMSLSEGMKHFLGLLLEKDRIRYLPQISSDYRSLADELSGILRARVTAAVEPDQAQQSGIKKGLEAQTGKKIELKMEVDPELIGGLKVEIGGKVFDGSVRTQLNRIEDTLKKG